MACATLKRHLEWDPLGAGPHAMSPRPAKRARRIMAGSSLAMGSSRQQYLDRQQAMTPSAFQDAAPKLTSGRYRSVVLQSFEESVNDIRTAKNNDGCLYEY